MVPEFFGATSYFSFKKNQNKKQKNKNQKKKRKERKKKGRTVWSFVRRRGGSATPKGQTLNYFSAIKSL
jgi:hypothetical protein